MIYLDRPIHSARFSFAKCFVACAAGLLLAACAGNPPNSDIEAARGALSGARSDPTVARHAPLELEQADLALRRAEAAWIEKQDEAQARHLAYLARQRTSIAYNFATARANEARLQSAGAERERLRAEAVAAGAVAATLSAQRQAAQAQAQALTAQQQAAVDSQRADALQAELELLQAKNTQRGMVVTLQDVLFESGRATLAPGAQRTADQLAALLRQYPERRLMIEGFTDNVGSVESNMDLSFNRAVAFRQALAERGIASERMSVRGYGSSYPVADNATMAGRLQNRRVELIFSDAFGNFVAR